jgi:hypothetical protein
MAHRESELHRDFVESHLLQYWDLDEFILNGLGREEIMGQSVFRPQLHYLAGDGASRAEVDFVGRYETIDEDVSALAALLGRPRPELPHLNRSPTPEQASMSRQAIERVADVYARDRIAFGYEPPRSL